MGDPWSDPQGPDGAPEGEARPPIAEPPPVLPPPGMPPFAGALEAPGVPPVLVQLLVQTRPWVRFLAVLGFISTGFMVLGALVVLVVPGFPPGGGVPGALKVGMALVYLSIAGVHLPPALFLYRYASHIQALQASAGAGDLERALAAQKSFWRYVGILALVVLCLYALIIVVALVAGLAALVLKAR